MEHQLALTGVEPYRWKQDGLIEPAVLNTLYDINRRWLELLAGPEIIGTGDSEVDRIALEVGRAAPATRSLLARCPFALFGARFHEDAYWARITGVNAVNDSRRAAWQTDTPSRQAGRAALAGFAQVAFFYGWHLTHLNPVAARLLLGVAEPVAALFKELSPARMQQLAEEHPQTVTPRWTQRHHFWRALLHAAEKGESHFAQARLLGIQMVPADLIPALGERLR